MKNEIDYNGNTMIPNIILLMQRRLNLTDRELMFFIKCYSINKNIIKDNELDLYSSHATLSRIRKSLKNKGYLDYTTSISKNCDGECRTHGVCYNWAGLINACEIIAAEHSMEKTI